MWIAWLSAVYMCGLRGIGGPALRGWAIWVPRCGGTEDGFGLDDQVGIGGPALRGWADLGSSVRRHRGWFWIV